MMFHEYILQTDLLFSPTTFYLVIAFGSALQLQLWTKNNMALLWESSRQAKKKNHAAEFEAMSSLPGLTIVGSILFACCYNMLQHSTRFFRYVKWDDPSKYTMMELEDSALKLPYRTYNALVRFDLVYGCLNRFHLSSAVDLPARILFVGFNTLFPFLARTKTCKNLPNHFGC